MAIPFFTLSKKKIWGKNWTVFYNYSENLFM